MSALNSWTSVGTFIGYSMVVLVAMCGLTGALFKKTWRERIVFVVGPAGVVLLLAIFGPLADPNLSAGSARTLALRLGSFALGSLVIAITVAALGGWVESRARGRASLTGTGSSSNTLRIRPNIRGRVLLFGVASLVFAAATLGGTPAGAGGAWWRMWACVLVGAIAAWGWSVGQRRQRSMVMMLVAIAGMAAAFAIADGASRPLLGFMGVALAGIGAIATLPREAGPNELEPRLISPDVHSSRDLSAGRSRRTSVALAIWIAMTPLVPLMARVGMEIRVQQYVHRHTPTAPAEAPIYGVVIARETFAIVIPGMSDDGKDLVRAAVMLDRSQFATREDLDHLEVGMVMPAEPIGQDLDAHSFQLKARVAHGDHFHDYDFKVVNTAKASLREMCMGFDAFGASPLMLFGVLLACVGGLGLSPSMGQSTLKRLAKAYARPLLLGAAAIVLGPAVCLGAVIGGISRVIALDCACERGDGSDAGAPGTWLLTWSALAVCLAPIGAGLSFVHVWL